MVRIKSFSAQETSELKIKSSLSHVKAAGDGTDIVLRRKPHSEVLSPI